MRAFHPSEPLAEQSGHWQGHARQWGRIGSPLRPCAEDVELFRQAVGAAAPCLLLGVTPELAGLSDCVTAIDISPAMIASVWPGIRPGRRAVQGDWLRLPFRAGAFDAVVGDGSPVLLIHPFQHRRLFAEAARVLRPGGRLAIRCFAAPEAGETPRQVQDAALGGGIGSFHAFKWRLAMAMVHEAGDPNIRVAAIHACFERLFPDRQSLSRRTGWPPEAIDTIDVYRDSDAVYSFPTRSELLQVVPDTLREAGRAQGGYELAERCPLLRWERTA